MSKPCKYAPLATPNAEAMTPRMAATFTSIKRKTIEQHRAGKCACNKPMSKGRA